MTSHSSFAPPRRGWRWLWPLGLAVVVFSASGRSQIAAPGWVDFDKVGHALVFGLMATLVARTQPPQRYWVGIVVASLYGIADEVRQSFTPGRSVEFADWIADTVGATLAVTLYATWVWYRRLLEFQLWPRPER